MEVAPLATPAAPPYGGTAYAYASPPMQDAPPIDPCDCRRGDYAHGQGRLAYGASSVYESYSESSALNSSVTYSGYGGHGYGYGFTGGVGGYDGYGGYGGYGGFYPYGGVGYSAGGYRDGRARVAGRDRDGFLTWAGKPVR